MSRPLSESELPTLTLLALVVMNVDGASPAKGCTVTLAAPTQPSAARVQLKHICFLGAEQRAGHKNDAGVGGPVGEQ